MHALLRKMLYATLLSSTLSCTVRIPDTQVCTVAGILSGGAYCAHTLNDDTETLTLSEFIHFLEPDETTGKSGAYCIPSSDFTNLQIALEQACRKLGAKCVKEVREQLEDATKRVVLLGEKGKKPKPKK